MADKRDIYQEVTDRIVASLEAGTVTWKRPWNAPDGMHRNPVSGTVYRGVNPFLLEMTAQAEGFGDPRWLTFKQAQSLGGAIRKGERSTLVVFWKTFKGEDAQGREKTIPMLRHFNVFNVAQADGCELEPMAERPAFDPIASAEAILEGMPNAPKLTHDGGNRAYYVPAWDSVHMPERDLFPEREHYYGTAFHELVHSTGHASRLNRPEVAEMGPSRSFGDEDYSREELVAEFGAAMLCGTAGIMPATIDQSAAYIAGWLKALRNDKKLAVSAAGRAQKAADYIRGI